MNPTRDQVRDAVYFLQRQEISIEDDSSEDDIEIAADMLEENGHDVVAGWFRGKNGNQVQQGYFLLVIADAMNHFGESIDKNNPKLSALISKNLVRH